MRRQCAGQLELQWIDDDRNPEGCLYCIRREERDPVAGDERMVGER
jgi:hypothetical protein